MYVNQMVCFPPFSSNIALLYMRSVFHLIQESSFLSTRIFFETFLSAHGDNDYKITCTNPSTIEKMYQIVFPVVIVIAVVVILTGRDCFVCQYFEAFTFSYLFLSICTFVHIYSFPLLFRYFILSHNCLIYIRYVSQFKFLAVHFIVSMSKAND